MFNSLTTYIKYKTIKNKTIKNKTLKNKTLNDKLYKYNIIGNIEIHVYDEK